MCEKCTTLVVFVIKNPINLDFCQTRSIQSNEKEHVRQIYHRDAHYYVTVSHNTSVSPCDWPFGIGY